MSGMRVMARPANSQPPLELSDPPPGFDAVDKADGSLNYRGPRWVYRRLVENHVRLIAIRHGQSQSNADPGILLYGQSETPLTEKGIQQARDCALKLYDQLGGDDWLQWAMRFPKNLPVFISSPLSRAMDSAVILADYMKSRVAALGGEELAQQLSKYFEVKPDPRLMETNFGKYEKHDLSEVQQAYPDFINNWRPPQGMGTDFCHAFPGPNGESRADVMRRGANFLNGVAQLYPDRTVVMMSHSECILGMKTVLGLAPVQDGKVRAETGNLANATPYFLVGEAVHGTPH